MTRLWLVRHATTSWTGVRWCGSTDIPLNETGLDAAAALATRLGPMLAAPVAIRTSPLARARQTAAPLSAALGVDPDVDQDLREIGFGVIEGVGWDDIEQEHPQIAARIMAGELKLDWPGGEQRAETEARVQVAWDAIEAIDATSVVVFSHGAIIRALAAARGIELPLLRPATGCCLERHDGTWLLTPEQT